jgi:serine protease Do
VVLRNKIHVAFVLVDVTFFGWCFFYNEGLSMKTKSMLAALGIFGVAAGGFTGGLYYQNLDAFAQSKPPVATKAPLLWSEGVVLPEKGAMPSSFAELATVASPAVVFISTKQKSEKGAMFAPGHPFNDFFGPGGKDQQGLGSGFIINKKGHILTNYHVVESADEIRVTLEDGETLPAKIIGSDEKTDVALIQIETKKDLPIMALGNSDKLRVGDWVVAIGNPFGLDHTVTAGIVSAKGRAEVDPGKIRGAYHDFIQTDASINPGNSGGPLINVRGEVIGINTAINAAGQGIGFAIPIDMVKDIVPQLASAGKVSRSWMGVSIQPLPADVAKSMGLTRAEGALIGEVIATGPAALAGMQAGDVVINFAGKEIKRSEELRWAASTFGAGKTAEIKILRDGKPVSIQVTLKQFPSENELAAVQKKAGVGGVNTSIEVGVTGLSKELAEKFGGEIGKGVLITDISEKSPANGRLMVGDIVLSIGDRAQLSKTISTPDEFKAAVDGIAAGKPVLAYVLRDGSRVFVAFNK